MKVRAGMVSNSSSGSFIFPKGIDVKRATEIIDEIEKFISKLKGEKVSAGLNKPVKYEVSGHTGRYIDEYYEIKKKEDYIGCVIVHTTGNNTCPYVIHQILEDIVECVYIHYG